MKDKTPLLPCPFCGTEPIWFGEIIKNSQYSLKCPECQIIMTDDRRDKVVGRWNTRVEKDKTPPK